MVRSARADLDVHLHAVDISQEMIDFAAIGVYSLSYADVLAAPNEEVVRERGDIAWNTARDQGTRMFERMSNREIDAMFETSGDQAVIRPRLREGVTWLCGDACDAQLREAIGMQDVVFANRFLCHMNLAVAGSCLCNTGELVKPGGYHFVSGVDIDVRAKVALRKAWKPVELLMREAHDGDHSLRDGWPLEYWGLEPFDDHRADWKNRYASAFQLDKRG